MKKDVLIEIRGTQNVDGEKETVEIITTGQYYLKNKSFYIMYDETESTGYADCKTTVKLDSKNVVSMIRNGAHHSQIIVESGVRHQCNYGTQLGNLIIGIMGNNVVSELNENGGRLEFEYSLDVNTNLASENKVSINVKEC